MVRIDGRSSLQLRPFSTQFAVFPQATGSVLLSMGMTRVLCAVSVVPGVPSFLRGKGTGWLTAEYAMLPASCSERVSRDTASCKKNGRSVEISRMIGRCLRSCVDLQTLGEYTIHIDCDVLNADGSTRVAALIGAQLALIEAERKLLEKNVLKKQFCVHKLAAVSVGLQNEEILVDLTYQEDVSIDADMNFVMTHDGSLVEIQGSAEKSPIPSRVFLSMQAAAKTAIDQIALWMASIDGN
jgi:ribonuclease PH